MANFSENIAIKIHNDSTLRDIIYIEGTKIDYLDIYNQSHMVGKWNYEIEKRQIDCSDEVFKIYGINKLNCKIDVNRFFKFHHHDDCKSLENVINQCIAIKKGFTAKLRLHRQDGALRIVELNGAPVVDKNKNVMKMVGTLRDITSLTEYENLRKATMDLIIRTVQTSPISTALIDKQLRYIAWSNQWLVDFNLNQDVSIKGKDINELLPDLANTLSNGFESALRGNPVGIDNVRLQRLNGVTHILDWRMQPYRDARHNVGGVLIMLHIKYTGMPREEEKKSVFLSLNKPITH